MVDEAVPGTLGELGKLYPPGASVTIAGRSIDIPVSGVRHCSQVVARGMALGVQLDTEADELIFIDEHPDEAAALLVFALPHVDASWIAALDAIDKLDLALAWWKVNKDFFVRRLLPARARLQAEMPDRYGDGLTRSIVSSNTGTATPTNTPLPQPSFGSPPSTAPNGANV